MPRFVFAILALVILVPTALGAPLATVGVAPGGEIVHDESRPYYLLLTASEPEGPRRAQRTDDCAYVPGKSDQTPPTASETAVGIASRVLSWKAAEDPSISSWYPTCLSTTTRSITPVNLLDGQVSYDVVTGRYYVESNNTVALPVPAFSAPLTSLTIRVNILATGTIGVGSEADCEGCPPPTV